jgi:hypothetical protein
MRPFGTKGNMLRHKLIHERRYDSENAQDSSRIAHELGHTGKKPYACSVCERTFVKKGNKLSHEQIHTGEQIHNGEKPHACSFCEKTFGQKWDKWKHERRLHCQRMLQKQIDDKQEMFFRVARSEIEGHGLFANIAVPKNTDILEYDGERITRAQADVAEAEYLKEGIKKIYLLAVIEAKDLVIDATKVHRKARLINHMCALDDKRKCSRKCKDKCGPNCEQVVIKRRGQERVLIRTLRDLAKG